MEQKRNTSLRLSNQPAKLLPRDISESLGKLPPQCLDLEEAVLGATMMESSSLGVVADILRPEDFYSEAHRTIWEAIINLYKESRPIDMRTVTAQLRKEGKIELVGGAYIIAELTSKVSSAANIEYHARVIIEASIKRSLIMEASQTHSECYEDSSDVFEIIDRTQSRLDKISNTYFRGSAISSNELYKKTINHIYKSRNEDGITGVPTGHHELDRITGGWQNPDLVLVAARPSMGKTACVVEMAKNAAMMFKRPVAIFSLEMSAQQLMQRMIASEAEIDLENIMRGRLSDTDIEQMCNGSNRIANMPLFIDDTPAISILELRAKARRLKHENNIELLIVDYLQLMRGDNSGNREQEIASISRGLKSLAKELGIPIIALSQLSREVEKRADKRPQLADLRESGSLEQDADTVIFLFRAEYYKIMQDEDGNPTQGIIEFIVAKNRNGKTGSVLLKFIGKYAKIVDLNQGAPEPRPDILRPPLVDFSQSRLMKDDLPGPGEDMPF